MRECRAISGVETETNDSAFIPRFFSYHFVVVWMEETVRTRWSRDVTFAAGVLLMVLLY